MTAPVHYSEKIDSIIYGPEARTFTPEDFIALACACLDQAMNSSNATAIRCALDHLEPLAEPV